MEKIIQQNNDEVKMKYIFVSLLSLLTLKKVKSLEKLRVELKERQEEEDYNKI
ncbi:hypothetical protein [Oceanobacillus kapialis]|uniref:hypothetical protein n=1 Tax=Oceanobacillus kapialis TaxID=481353 RepID=UPI00384EEE02